MGCKKKTKDGKKMPCHDPNRGPVRMTLDNLEVFGLNRVRDFVVFYELLDTLKVSISDVKKWVADKDAREELEAKKVNKIVDYARKFMELKPRCPDCNSILEAIPVNHSKCTMIGGKYKYLIQCVSYWNCGYERAITKELSAYMSDSKREQLVRLQAKINREANKER